MNTHLWGWMKICMLYLYGVVLLEQVKLFSVKTLLFIKCSWCDCVIRLHFYLPDTKCITCCLSVHLEYSKRVYQGVRVKHTVKDLLAEKRSRQTNGPRYNVSTTYSKPILLLSCPVSPHFIFLPNQTVPPQLTFCWWHN